MNRSPLVLVLALLITLLSSVVPGQVTKLADLDLTIGGSPSGPVLEMGGNYYFTCESGGMYGAGTIVVHIPGTGTFPLTSLYGPITGSNPRGGLLLIGTDLYFTCVYGGTTNQGTLSRFNLMTGVTTAVVNLTSQMGSNPFGTPTLYGGAIYFTCHGGGNSYGSVIKYDLQAAQVSAVIALDYYATYPCAGLTVVGTDLYFTCANGIPCPGALCKYNTLTDSVQKVDSVCGSPQGDVLVSGGDLLFTAVGYPQGLGGVYKYTSGIGLAQLANLSYASGTGPTGGMIEDGGLYYFTSSAGIAGSYNGSGGITLFNGVAQGVASTTGTQGSSPRSTPLVHGGQLVFTCHDGGANNWGSLVSCPFFAHAQRVSIGQGCGGGFTPTLAVAVPPTLGQILSVSISGAPALTPGGYVYSGVPAAPVQLSPGCSAYLDLATVAELGTMFTTPFGAHSLTYPLPVLPLLSGVVVRLQAYVITPTLGPGFGLSNGLELTLGY